MPDVAGFPAFPFILNQLCGRSCKPVGPGEQLQGFLAGKDPDRLIHRRHPLGGDHGGVAARQRIANREAEVAIVEGRAFDVICELILDLEVSNPSFGERSLQ